MRYWLQFPMRNSWFPALVFLGFLFFYAALSPGSVGGVGYLTEELQSGQSLLDRVAAWLRGQPPPPFVPSRHGLIPVLLHLPFIVAGRWFVTADFALAFESVLATALIDTIIFLWVRRFAGPVAALIAAFLAAFTTMLWPYAYIGLETTQSLFVLLTGYLALTSGRRLTWPAALTLAFVAAIALSAKSTSIVLLPAVAYCIWLRLRGATPAPLQYGLAVAALILTVLGGSAWSRSFFWGPAGGAGATLSAWIIPDPLLFPLHLAGYIGSPNKGLFVYCPVLLIGFLVLPLAWASHRQLVTFTVLVFAGLAGSFALLLGWSDEVWGPRYVHSAVAPIVVCIGVVWPVLSVRWKTATAALSMLGLTVSALGALFYYGLLHHASMAAGQNTLENLQGDITWNHVRFNARLFGLWLRPAEPAHWKPDQRWLYTPPANAVPVSTVDLRPYARPQSPLLRDWRITKSGTYLRVTVFYALCLLLGVVCAVYCCAVTIRASMAAARAAHVSPATAARRASRRS
jgi:hypothetical protein